MKKKKWMAVVCVMALTVTMGTPVKADLLNGDAVVATLLSNDQSTNIEANPDGSWSTNVGVYVSKSGKTSSDLNKTDVSEKIVYGTVSAENNDVTFSPNDSFDGTKWSLTDYNQYCIIHISGNVDIAKDYKILFTVAQDEGGFSRGSDNIIIHVTNPDRIAPSITLIGSKDVHVNQGDPYIDEGATASDNRDGNITSRIITHNPVNTSNPGTYLVTYDVTDTAGNPALEINRSVTVDEPLGDITPPVITADDVTAEATGPGGAAVSFTLAATDDVDGIVPVSCDYLSGTLFPLGVTTVTCTAIDSSNNSSIKTFTVTVLDTTAPEIASHSDVTAEATGPDGTAVIFEAPLASDLVDGTYYADCSPASGSIFAVGDTIVTCTAEDKTGNRANPTQFMVHVVDTTPPVLSLPADITVYAEKPQGADVSFAASAEDLVDGNVAVVTDHASGSVFAPGTTVVKCSAADSHGNVVSGSFKVTVNYNFSGFFSPVDMKGITNIVKAGSAVPIKFNLHGNMGLSVFAKTPYVNAVNLATNAASDEIETVVTAGSSSLSYDSATDTYTYVWKTDKSWTGLAKQFNIKLLDGSVYSANFKFK